MTDMPLKKSDAKPVTPGATPAKARVERAALQLFARQGVDRVSIKQIAYAASLSEGAMYRHYKSKDDLARAMFEAVHGSAPDIAGKQIANPCALMLAGAQMLTYLGMNDRAETLRASITETAKSGDRVTPDLGGSGSTGSFADAIIERITKNTG